jgi:hypothetical protein
MDNKVKGKRICHDTLGSKYGFIWQGAEVAAVPPLSIAITLSLCQCAINQLGDQ